MINQVPKIQRNPRTVSANAMHYGYVAYQDIQLGGKQVQPEDSPYRQVMPCRELIPFTNIEVGEIDEKQVQNPKRPKGVPPVKRVQKTAYECAFEMEASYAEWDFKILSPLTGYSEEDAFRIFQVVQPFHYKLKDIQTELGAAEDRIAQTESYFAYYEGDKVELEPLTEAEQEVARKVLDLITSSANHAVEIGMDKQQKTIVSMTSRFAGGEGKSNPDPLDRKLSVEFGTKLPQLIDVQQQEAKEQTEADDLKREELELRKQEIALRQREIELKEQEANREKMAAVRAAKNKEVAAA